MNIKCFSFQDLSVEQLYDLLKLRVDVFVVEQDCAYAELDNQDQNAIHFIGEKDGELIAYARVLFENGHLHIGRIIVKKEHRGSVYGQSMMENCLDHCRSNYSNETIHLTAQAQLERYYQKFGFVTTSDPFDWDGILHVKMEMRAT